MAEESLPVPRSLPNSFSVWCITVRSLRETCWVGFHALWVGVMFYVCWRATVHVTVQTANAYYWSYLDKTWQSPERSFHHWAASGTVGVFTEEEIKTAFSGEICWDQEVPPSVPQECQSITTPSISLHNGGLTENILWVDFPGSKAVTNSQFAYFLIKTLPSVLLSSIILFYRLSVHSLFC